MRPSASGAPDRSSGCRSRAGSRPAARKSRNFSASNVPGFASSVISASAASWQPRAESRRAAGRSRGAESRLGVPPPKKIECTRRPHTDGSARSRSAISASTYASLGQRAARLVRVEVAVRALAHAPRDVHVERERRQRGEAELAAGGGERDGGGGHGRSGREPDDRGVQAGRQVASASRWPERIVSASISCDIASGLWIITVCLRSCPPPSSPARAASRSSASASCSLPGKSPAPSASVRAGRSPPTPRSGANRRAVRRGRARAACAGPRGPARPRSPRRVFARSSSGRSLTAGSTLRPTSTC